jgi:hypothetical protein
MGLPLSQTPFDADAYLAWEAGQLENQHLPPSHALSNLCSAFTPPLH